MNRSQRKIKVCCFCESWESGGIEAFLANVILHMDRSGLEIDIVAERLEKSIFTEKLQNCGINFYQLSGSTRKIKNNLQCFQDLLQKRGYDIIHLNIYQGLSLLYLRLARKAGVPIRIAHSHNTKLRESLTKRIKLFVHNWARKHFAKEITHRWASSKAAAKFLFGSDMNFTFVPNGIDITRFRFDSLKRNKIRRELKLEEKLVIGNVGRLCYQKNQMFLLKVFQQIHQYYPASVLLLIGDGEDRNNLEDRTKTLNLEDSVIFCGTIEQVDQFYCAMDLFLFPSYFEGLGIACVEAQAAGLPVLCSEHIPEEAIITDSVTQMTLHAGSMAWAEKVLNMNFQKNRTDGADQVFAAGFDVGMVAEMIRKQWMEDDLWMVQKYL